ncbi:MAG: hypothetical protein A2Y10_11895 [Planctomycetes bacterium GWF2_41_51]|nr:MAG: hypothetical protein A2Y10_11895 [Planctomycetes bacterium GWF2_41_51]HBG28647.1 hypothetical protein [Phycisphaerales bacterium]
MEITKIAENKTEINKNIKAVIFDMGNVLVSLEFSRGLLKFCCGDSIDNIPEVLKNRVFSDFAEGKINPEQFHRLTCEQFGLNFSFELFCHHWCNMFNPMHGIDAIIKELDGKVELGLLSDTDPLHWAFVNKNWPFIKTIKKTTLSFEINCCKPAPQAFLKAAKKVGVAQSECLFIDDLQRNIDGAKNVGMNALQFINVENLYIEFVKNGLLEAHLRNLKL